MPSSALLRVFPEERTVSAGRLAVGGDGSPGPALHTNNSPVFPAALVNASRVGALVRGC